MSIEQADIIDGLGVRQDGAVEMLISDHLLWDSDQHLQLLASKVEAYANAALSGQLAQVYPLAKDKPICIKLVWQHVPDPSAVRFFEAIEGQLKGIGIEFTQMALPARY